MRFPTLEVKRATTVFFLLTILFSTPLHAQIVISNTATVSATNESSGVSSNNASTVVTTVIANSNPSGATAIPTLNVFGLLLFAFLMAVVLVAMKPLRRFDRTGDGE